MSTKSLPKRIQDRERILEAIPRFMALILRPAEDLLETKTRQVAFRAMDQFLAHKSSI